MDTILCKHWKYRVREYRKRKVISIDKEDPFPYELNEIKKQNCIQCYTPFEENKRIIFTTLSDGKIIWWHGRQKNSSGCYKTFKTFENGENKNTKVTIYEVSRNRKSQD